MNLVDSILQTAYGYIGTIEGSEAHSEIIDLYNKGRYSDAYKMTLDDPWCCAFVVACFVANGAEDIIPCYAYCDGMINTFKQWSRWKGRFDTVNAGDIVFYDWNGDGSSDHVGIVYKNVIGELSVIEGNKSDSVSWRHITVNSSQIIGYGVPNYSREGGTVVEPTKPDDKYIKTLPIIRYGDKNVFVKILQVLLNHYMGARLEVDGDFGPRTKNAVACYQMANKLMVDGEVGPETWGYLLTKEK